MTRLIDERIRATILGFHIPDRTRISPPQSDETLLDVPRVRATLYSLGVTTADIVRIEPCASRRCVGLVTLSDGSCVLLKWLDEGHKRPNEEFRKLEFLSTLDLPDLTRSALQSVLAGGPDSRLIVLDAFDSCISLHNLLRLHSLVPTRKLVMLAAALGGIHNVSVEETSCRYPEWLRALPVPKDTSVDLHEYSNGCGVEFDEYLRSVQALEPDFRDLHKTWRAQSFIHFDLRSDNVLLPTPSTAPPIRIIDWELSGFGDPLYDVGTVIGHFVIDWFRSLSSRKVDSEKALGASRENITVFLAAYRRVVDGGRYSEKTIFQYAGLTLLLYVVSRLQQLGSLDGAGHLCLQLAKRFVREPENVGNFLNGRSEGLLK